MATRAVRKSARRSPGHAPTRIRVRMYQVGFGDCFLVSFEYDKRLNDGRDERHILIDFGSTRLPAGRKDLHSVAKLIREHSAGEIDVVVISHRHKDHLSAFADEEIVSQLTAGGPPKLVVRSWTEDPDAPRDAIAGPAASIVGMGADSARFLATLLHARGFAEDLFRSIRDAPRSIVGDDLRQMASDQLANQRAVDQLDRWASGAKAAYLRYGQPSRIEEVVPGITVRVLGPPTVEQHPAIRSQRSDDPDEFWMIHRRLLGASQPENVLSRRVPADHGPIGPVRWLIDRMARQQVNSLLRVVRVLDSVLNNTSVILLFEVDSADGGKRMLFGGDAQIENWEYALKSAPDRQANLDALRLADLYKVGHHGSRNATPHTLFDLWLKRGAADRDMVALMSTKSGVHGHHAETAVPRATLAAALDTRMRLFSTDDLAPTRSWVELEADLAAGGPFVEVSGE